jgi:hypothetical protein
MSAELMAAYRIQLHAGFDFEAAAGARGAHQQNASRLFTPELLKALWLL